MLPGVEIDDEVCIQRALKLTNVDLGCYNVMVYPFLFPYFFIQLVLPCSYLIGGTIPTSLLFLVETIITPLVIYILWWLHNHSIVRWSCISVNRLWAKMVSFCEVAKGKRFVCCTLTIVHIIYNTVGWSIASTHNFCSIFTTVVEQ